MIILPLHLTATPYPGYFWHLKEKVLYSCKSGELRRIKISRPNKFNHISEYGYHVSVRGVRHFISVSALQQLKLKDSMMPIISPKQQEFSF